jgi:Flp pilus assembly protein TadG
MWHDRCFQRGVVRTTVIGRGTSVENCRRLPEMSRRSRRLQGGQALIFVALMLPVLFGMVGIGFDIGYLELMKRMAQTAADAGALAGAINVYYGSSTLSANARAGTAANGFTNGSNGVTVTVNNPPKSGNNVGNDNAVEVIVTQTTPTFFLKMLADNSANVSARAVASSISGDCVFALASSGTGLLFPGGLLSLTDINVPNCAIIVDSNSSSAVQATGIFTIVNVTALQIGIVGQVGNCFFCSFSPTPVTGIAPESDPLGYLSPPSVGSCAGTAKTITSGTVTVNPSIGCYNVAINGTANVTFMPGEYASIVVNSAFAPTLTFQSGLYIIQGSGGLNLTGAGATLQGNGVTFYIGPSAGSVTVNGIANYINLVAPTTGTWAGILIYQDRANGQSACVGGCSGSVTGILNFSQIQGALYFPDATLSFTGCCQNSAGAYYTAYEIVVANHLSFLWDYFNDDYSSLPGGSPVKKTVLVE